MPSFGNELSPSPLDRSSSQLARIAGVYACFSALLTLSREQFGGELGGKLLLYGQLDAHGIVVALAANIAGAATLGVDADAERLRQGIRHGFCDFVVNHLDEALRILKNEIRKKQPVSVCVEADPLTTLTQAVERGLQPDLLAVNEQFEAVETLIARGAVRLMEGQASDARPEEVTWTAESSPALWLPKVDELAAKVLPTADERSRWLRLAPRYLGRTMAGEHYLQMTPDEAGQFETLVAEAMASGAIGTKITIERRERRLSPPPS